MAKVHCVNDVVVHAVKIELEGATPITPLEPIVIQFGSPQATDEWPIPPAPLSIALDRDTAIELAVALYLKATAQT